MSRFASIRGWIECDFEAVSGLESLISELWFGPQLDWLDRSWAEIYWRGWHFPDQPLNWLAFISYGADVKVTALSSIRSCLEQVAKSNLEARGCFFIDVEEERSRRWRFDETGNFEDTLHPAIFPDEEISFRSS